jgi:hypothetical protein
VKKLATAVLLLAAATASAQWQTVLTNDATVWAANEASVSVKLDLMRREGDVTSFVRVPGTEDSVIESHPRLAYDNATGALFAMWRHGDEIRVSRLDASGRWSESKVVTRGQTLEGLQLVVTRSSDTTLLHGAWWSGTTAEYALVAFDGPEVLSTVVVALDELANVRAAANEPEDTGGAVHPPLAMVRSGEAVDVAYGAPHTTTLTRLTVKPEKVGGNARMWRPSGRSGRRTDPSGLTSLTTAAVQSFIVEGRLVLFTPDSRFRYVVLDNGRWTPIRMFALDEKLTSEELVRALRRSVLEHGSDDEPVSE